MCKNFLSLEDSLEIGFFICKNSNLSGKAPTRHASSATTYGIGTTAAYGHCMTINNLTQSSHADGKALSAYQGYLLNQSINTKVGTSYVYTKGDSSNLTCRVVYGMHIVTGTVNVTGVQATTPYCDKIYWARKSYTLPSSFNIGGFYSITLTPMSSNGIYGAYIIGATGNNSFDYYLYAYESTTINALSLNILAFCWA